MRGKIKGKGKEMRTEPRALGQVGTRAETESSSSDNHIFLSEEEVKKVSVKDTLSFQSQMVFF